MKARVKATGEIVEVHTSDDADFVDRNGKYYWEHELFFGSLDVSSNDDPDYWTRLEHQYAGMAMQGMVKTYEQMMRADIECKMDCCEHVDAEVANEVLRSHAEACAEFCVEFAHALVKKLKKKEERK